MERPVWKGHITFGLVNVPVALHRAERRADLQFRLIDSRNQAGIRYERVNEETGEEVPWNEIAKAYEYDKDNYVVLTDKDFKRAAVEATQTIDIEEFVDYSDLSPEYFDRPYYLVPEKKQGEKGYVILREALSATGKVGIAKIVIRTRQYLAALMPRKEALVLNLLRYQQELRDADELDFPGKGLREYKVSTDEIEMAEQLINHMATEWHPEQFHDEYRDALMTYIEKKAKMGGKAVEEPVEEKKEEEPTDVINIMHLLKKSVETSGKVRKKAVTKEKPPRHSVHHRKRTA